MRTSDTDRTAGFTLLETIVAFVILSTVLGAATLSVSYSARLFRRSDEVRAANQLAEQLIAERFDEKPHQAKEEDGREGDLVWKITRRNAGNTAVNGAKLLAFDLVVSTSNRKALAERQSFYIEAAP